MTNERPVVALVMPRETTKVLFSEDALDRLRAGTTLHIADYERGAFTGDVSTHLADAEVCITGWYSPRIDSGALRGARSLRLIVHTGGSVKSLIDPDAYARGVVVCHLASIIADSVAESTILSMLMGLRRHHEMDRGLKGGRPAHDVRSYGRLLGATTVGIVGAGYVGRKVIPLLHAFGARVLVYDPYLDEGEARMLGVTSIDLATLMSESDVLSLHAPDTPETEHLIGRSELDLLHDGAVVVNSADPSLFDEEALLDALRAGRIWAAIDRFEPEPLPLESPFRHLDNVLITPHVAGSTTDTLRRQGDGAVDEIERFLRGDTLQYRVDPAILPRMA